jgi:hypothetical protein
MPKTLKERIKPSNQIRKHFQKILLKPSSKMLLAVWVCYFIKLNVYRSILRISSYEVATALGLFFLLLP